MGAAIGGMCIACHISPAIHPYVVRADRASSEFAQKYPPRWCFECWSTGRWRELFSDILEPVEEAPVYVPNEVSEQEEFTEGEFDFDNI